MRKHLNAFFIVSLLALLSACVTATDAEVLPTPALEAEVKEPKNYSGKVPLVRLTTYMFCSPAEHVLYLLKKEYDEEPLLTFHTVIPQYPQAGPMPAVIFANAEKGSMSVVVFVDLTNKDTQETGKFACLRMFGDRPTFFQLFEKMKDKEYGAIEDTDKGKPNNPPGRNLDSKPPYSIKPGGQIINYVKP